MKLYYSDVLMPRKVCALARYLQLPVEYIYLELGEGEHKAPAYLAINPAGKVPALVDGERVVVESDAILVALAQAARSPLWPEGAAQADAVRWLVWNAHHFAKPCGTLYFEHVIKPRFTGHGPDEVAAAAAQAEFCQFAPVLEGHLADRKWLLGDALSIADFALANPFAYADRAPFPLRDYPHIRRWHEQLNALEAWRNAFPAR